MKKGKQPYLPGFQAFGIKEFGGTLIKGNPREARPISIKRPMHVVMRSSLAKGPHSFLSPKRSKRIRDLIHRMGSAKGVKVYRFANSGNHLHLIVLSRTREGLSDYLRAISGLIARMTLNVERGRALGVKFWDARPYTGILEWGRQFRSAARYLLQNTLEAIGFIPYQPRGHKTRLLSAAG